MKGPLILSTLWISAVGSAVVGGVFFAFSTFVITALGSLPPAHGLAAMQAINRSVLGSLFLLVFLVTTLAIMVVATAALVQRGPGSLPALAGGILFLVGSFAVTAVANVPLNDSIAALAPTHPDSVGLWTNYLKAWTQWNHVRTFASLLATVIFMCALQSLVPQEAQQ